MHQLILNILFMPAPMELPSLQGYSSADIANMPQDELLDLAGNVIIDYNDNAEHGNPKHEQFWDNYLKPINTAYLAARPEHAAHPPIHQLGADGLAMLDDIQ